MVRRGIQGCLSALLLWVAIASPSPLVAQSIARSEINGSVMRADGAPLNGAFVVLTERSTGLVTEATSRSNGNFQFTTLIPGEYEVRVEALGYLPLVMSSVRLNPQEALVLSLSVRPAPPLALEVDTTRSGPANTLRQSLASLQAMDGEIFENLPRLSHESSEVTELFTSMDPFFGGNGLPGSESVLFADGVPQTSVRHPLQRASNLSHFSFPTLALRSIDLVTAAQDVEWSGGAGRILSLSSTEQTHSPVSAFASVGLPTLGQPSVIDDSGTPQLSFWGGAGTSVSLGQTANLILAGEAMRRRTWRDPSLPSDIAVEMANGSVIPADQLRILGNPSLDDLNLFSGLVRFDWKPGEATRFGVRVSGGRYEALSSALPGGGLSHGHLLPGSGTELSTVVDATWRVDPRFELEWRIGASFGSLDTPGSSAERAGLRGLPSSYLVSEGVTLGLQDGLEGYLSRWEIFATPMLHFQDGVHQVKAGTALRFAFYNYDHLVGSSDSYLFSSTSDFLQRNGIFTRTTGAGGAEYFSTSEIGGFVQYLWSPSPSFGILAGLRADSETVPVADSTDGGWQELTGVSRIPDVESVQKLGGTLGVHWDPWEDGSTLFRASAGVRNGRIDPTTLGEYHTLDGEVQVMTEAGILSSPGNRSTDNAPRRLALLGPEFSAPRTFEVVLEASKKILNGTRISIAGTMRRTDFLVRRADLNRIPEGGGRTEDGRPVFGDLAQMGSIVYALPGTNRRFPAFDEVWALNSDGWSTYRGVTVSMDRDIGTGLQIFSSYTLSKTEDNWFGASSLHPEASVVPASLSVEADPWEKGVSDFDVTHRATVAFSWAAPFLSRVRLTPVYRFSSGTPFTPMIRPGADLNGDGSMYNDVALVPGAEALGGLANEWSCLSSQSGSFATRNSCRAPAHHEIDLAMELNLFRVGESSLSLIVEGTNLTNSRSGLVDSTLLLPTGEPIVINSTIVTVPLAVNPGFGDLLVPMNSGRTLRTTIRIR